MNVKNYVLLLLLAGSFAVADKLELKSDFVEGKLEECRKPYSHGEWGTKIGYYNGHCVEGIQFVNDDDRLFTKTLKKKLDEVAVAHVGKSVRLTYAVSEFTGIGCNGIAKVKHPIDCKKKFQYPIEIALKNDDGSEIIVFSEGADPEVASQLVESMKNELALHFERTESCLELGAMLLVTRMIQIWEPDWSVPVEGKELSLDSLIAEVHNKLEKQDCSGSPEFGVSYLGGSVAARTYFSKELAKGKIEEYLDRLDPNDCTNLGASIAGVLILKDLEPNWTTPDDELQEQDLERIEDVLVEKMEEGCLK